MTEAASATRIRELESDVELLRRLKAEELARNERMCREIERLDAIAKAATAFVDEQGKYINAHNELTASANFAGEEWQALVAAVWAAGR